MKLRLLLKMSKIATVNAFNQNNFGIEGNKKSDKDEKTLF